MSPCDPRQGNLRSSPAQRDAPSIGSNSILAPKSLLRQAIVAGCDHQDVCGRRSDSDVGGPDDPRLAAAFASAFASAFLDPTGEAR
jgi:hypothetical protein